MAFYAINHIHNADDSWLASQFAIEYAVLFDFINPGLCALELPIALGGTSNHFRIRSLIDVGAKAGTKSAGGYGATPLPRKASR